MAQNPWFRMYHEFAKDSAIQCLDFADQRHYVVILCLKCDGTIDRKVTRANRDRLIRQGLGLSEKETTNVKKRLQELKLIDKNWQPKGWHKRQFVSDGSTQRTRKYRKNKETGNVPETLQGTSHDRHGNGPETEKEAETETDTEGEINPGSSIASLFNNPNRSPHRSQEKLGTKVDYILNTAIEAVMVNGQLDVYKLARTINQRDGKSNPEPSERFVVAVKNCIAQHKDVAG